jgi:hypothetical protein
LSIGIQAAMIATYSSTLAPTTIGTKSHVRSSEALH